MENQRESDIDKGNLEGEVLVEIYADLGLNLIHKKKPDNRIERLEETYGDIRNELLYLLSQDSISLDDEIESISLKSSERDTARRMANKVHYERKKPTEVVSLSWVPEYLSSPEIEEDYRKEIEVLDQNPNEEVTSRILEILSADETISASEVEERFSAEVYLDLDPWMTYLETQSVIEKVEDQEYRLVEENISDRFFGEKLNAEGRIKDQKRYGNDTWKP